MKKLENCNDCKEGTTGAVELFTFLIPLFIVTQLTERMLLKFTTLPETAYNDPIIFLQTGLHLPLGRWFLPLLGLMIVISFLARPIRDAMLVSWQELHSGPLLRNFLICAAVPIVWRLTTYNYNFYWDHFHGFDRSLVLLCFLLFFIRPIFVAPLLLLALPMLLQFQFPLQGASWATASLGIRIQIFFLAYLGIAIVTKGRIQNSQAFLSGILVIVAMHYWPSGWSKLESGWLIHDQIHFLLPAAKSAGWMASIPTSVVENITRTLSVIDLPLRFGAVLIEVSGLFILCFPRRSYGPILVSFVILHLGIVFMTGIFFWDWMLIECGFATLWLFHPDCKKYPALSNGARLCSIGLIASSSVWYQAPTLFWFDARASYSYEFKARSSDGREWQLPKHFFSPHNYEIRLQKLGYLTETHPIFDVTYGATNLETSKKLGELIQTNEILEAETKYGSLEFDPERRDTFVTFVRRFIQNYNRNPLRHSWLRYVSSPENLQASLDSPAIQNTKPIEQIEIIQRLTFFDGRSIKEVRREPVLTIKIPPFDHSINSRQTDKTP